MILTVVTRTNTGYMNEKTVLDSDIEFATILAKKMILVDKSNFYAEILEGSKLYYGDSRVKPMLKIYRDDNNL